MEKSTPRRNRMSRIHRGRFTADIDGDFVVFIVGMHVNDWKRIRHWLPVVLGMRRMLAHLSSHPEKGLLGFHAYQWPQPTVVQYWRNFEDLDRFASAPADPHLEPWRAYFRRTGQGGYVGVWHETFKVKAADFEAIYTNMPRFGLARAGTHVPVAAKGDAARQRIGAPRDGGGLA